MKIRNGHHYKWGRAISVPESEAIFHGVVQKTKDGMFTATDQFGMHWILSYRNLFPYKAS